MIKVHDVETGHHYEAGNTITFQCPICKDELDVADGAWWNTTCSCGYKWHGVAYAYTEDDKKE